MTGIQTSRASLLLLFILFDVVTKSVKGVQPVWSAEKIVA